MSNNYIIMLIGGLLGIILHSLFKIRAINKRMANETFQSVFREYMRVDIISIITSVVVVLIAMFVSSEYLKTPEGTVPTGIAAILQYKIYTFIKTTFVFVGWGADSIVYAFLGTAEKALMKKAEDAGVDTNDHSGT